MMVDRDELGMALAYLAGALPCKPKWVAVVSTEGDLVGEYLGKAGPDQVAWMITEVEAFGSRLAQDMGNGKLRYNLNVGTEGASLMFPVGGEFFVCLNLRDVRSLDGVLNGLNEGLIPLLDVLQVNAF